MNIPYKYVESYPQIQGKGLLPIFATIITKDLAKLHELQTVYYYEDALDLYEIVLVNNYNELTFQEIQQMRNEIAK
jgi:hypothetical protein